MTIRKLLFTTAASIAADELSAEEKLRRIRQHVRPPRAPSGKNRDQIKKARKQRHQSK